MALGARVNQRARVRRVRRAGARPVSARALRYCYLLLVQKPTPLLHRLEMTDLNIRKQYSEFVISIFTWSFITCRYINIALIQHSLLAYKTIDKVYMSIRL